MNLKFAWNRSLCISSKSLLGVTSPSFFTWAVNSCALYSYSVCVQARWIHRSASHTGIQKTARRRMSSYTQMAGQAGKKPIGMGITVCNYNGWKQCCIYTDFVPGWSEVLRSFGHCLQTQSQGHHITDHLEEKGMKRGSAWRSSLKGRDRVCC